MGDLPKIRVISDEILFTSYIKWRGMDVKVENKAATTNTPSNSETGRTKKSEIGHSSKDINKRNRKCPQDQMKIDKFFNKIKKKGDCPQKEEIKDEVIVIIDSSDPGESSGEDKESLQFFDISKKKPTEKKIKGELSNMKKSSPTNEKEQPSEGDFPPRTTLSVEVVDLCSEPEEEKVGNIVKEEDLMATDPLPQKRGSCPADVSSETKSTKSKKPKPLPPLYKFIPETNFAVDAFRFGVIPGVTHYFLTHFHADHYGGLCGKFEFPIYMSPITARLTRCFLTVKPEHIHEIELNKPITVQGVEVTAIDANHCPGAVMFLFKLPNGKCLLHTGDFRACPLMESEPVFWNNDIHTIYLDTTYIGQKKNTFCSQMESIDIAKQMVHKFKSNHKGKRHLFVCGSYVIGKERFWSALAREFRFTIWTEDSRKKALEAMQLEEIRALKFSEDPQEANLHILPMMKLSYPTLVEYFRDFETTYDVILAFRPSGWEKTTKSSLSSKINVVGIEYSEHSSWYEMKRFVNFLNPLEVISTVPFGGYNLSATPEVPKDWYNYGKYYNPKRDFQPTITSYLQRMRMKKEMQERTSSVTSIAAKLERGEESHIDLTSDTTSTSTSSTLKSLGRTRGSSLQSPGQAENIKHSPNRSGNSLKLLDLVTPSQSQSRESESQEKLKNQKSMGGSVTQEWDFQVP